MGEITVDLTKIKFSDSIDPLFKDTQLVLKNKNFIFAKNGSGKSTLSDHIRNQKLDEFDVHVFKGFESVLGVNERLDAFALSVDAELEQQQLKLLENQQGNKESERKKIHDSLIQPEDLNSKNLYTKKISTHKELEKIKTKIDKFYVESAKIIKLMSPSIVENPSAYNKISFHSEISHAKMLQKVEIAELKKVIQAETKQILKVQYRDTDYEKFLEAVNSILQSKVKEKKRIQRLDTQRKVNFAQEGLAIFIENKENICSFCGNEISLTTIKELESYFSADEVKELQNRIDEGISQILDEKRRFINIKIPTSNLFYPKFIDSVASETQEFEKTKNNINSFWDVLLHTLKDKKANLFSNSEPLTIELPEKINFDRINELIQSNNDFSNNLVSEQKKAKNALRYHEIATLIESNSYNVMLNEEKNAQSLYNEAEKAFNEQMQIETQIEQELQQLSKDIEALKPKAEKVAIQHINEKLKLKVEWELDFFDDEESGYYQVKQNGRYRGITQLSTGEKNVIAFLYFIEKLGEIKKDSSQTPKKKIIIFDDPMSSNDNVMQYLIISELQNLFQGKDKTKFVADKDYLIILTHNIHFYLNVQPHGNFKDNKGKTKYDKCNFYRIESGRFTKILSEKQDFKTSYDSLWVELKDLYECGHKNSMLNSMRRIIETYTNFNSINPVKFYRGNEQYLKLFNVHSHSIDDLSAETFTEDKAQMKELFEKIFTDNNVESHFQEHWKS